MKAHTDEEDVLSGVISLEDQLGNQAADTWAGAAAERNSTLDDTINSQIDGMVWLIQDRLVEVYTHFYQPAREGERALMPRPTRSTDNDALVAQGHELERLNPRHWKCRICGQSWHSNQRKVIAGMGQCPGIFMYDHLPAQPGGPRIAPRGSQVIVNGRVLHPTHNLAWHRGVYFCWRCGYLGTQKRVAQLTDLCRGHKTPAQAKKLGKLRSGMCPLNSGIWPLGDRDPTPPEARCLPTLVDGDLNVHY